MQPIMDRKGHRRFLITRLILGFLILGGPASGAAVELYSSTVSDQFFDYSEPQENGNRTDVRWVSLRGEDGIGLLAEGEQPLSVTALRYTTDDLEQARHSDEIERRDFATLNLDHAQRGVGGGDSWGAMPLAHYLIPPLAHHDTFTLRPVSRSNQVR